MNANTLKEIIPKPFIQPHIPMTINNPLSYLKYFNKWGLEK